MESKGDAIKELEEKIKTHEENRDFFNGQLEDVLLNYGATISATTKVG